MRLRKRPGLRSGPRTPVRTTSRPPPTPVTQCNSLPPPEPAQPVPLIDEEEDIVIVMDDDDAGLIDLFD